MTITRFQSSFRLFGILSIAMALFSLSGGHWMLFQSIAWSHMIQTYSSEGSFKTAIQKTFDGQHRCSLCKKIDQAKQQEKKIPFLNESLKKKEGILEKAVAFLKLFPTFYYFPQIRKNFYLSLIIRPLLQPPRSS